jgi:hypothetical protein
MLTASCCHGCVIQTDAAKRADLGGSWTPGKSNSIPQCIAASANDTGFDKQCEHLHCCEISAAASELVRSRALMTTYRRNASCQQQQTSDVMTGCCNNSKGRVKHAGHILASCTRKLQAKLPWFQTAVGDTCRRDHARRSHKASSEHEQNR